MTTSTTISLSPSGQLFLALPGHDGSERQINLAEGKVEVILKQLLRKQREDKSVGKDAGATWRFMLEADLLEALARYPVRRVTEGQNRESKTQATTDELGL